MGRHVGKWAPIPQWKRGTVQSMENDHQTATETQEKRRVCSLAYINQLSFVPKDAGIAALKGNFKMHVFDSEKNLLFPSPKNPHKHSKF